MQYYQGDILVVLQHFFSVRKRTRMGKKIIKNNLLKNLNYNNEHIAQCFQGWS